MLANLLNVENMLGPKSELKLRGCKFRPDASLQ